ncbi:UNVERIFIED_CONTAM: hypothetical protein O8I53_11510 [Campylobacter lari]
MINNGTYSNNNFVKLNGKNISVNEIINNIPKPSIVLTNNGLFIEFLGRMQIENEHIIISNSTYNLNVEYALFSNPFESYKPNNLSYDNLNIDELKEKLSASNLFNNFIMNTEINNKNYEFNFEYLKEFKSLDLLKDIDILTTENYTRYLTDEELTNDKYKLFKSLVLNSTKDDFVLKHIINEAKLDNLLSEDIDLNKSDDELKVILKSALNDKYDLLEEKYTLMKQIIDV